MFTCLPGGKHCIYLKPRDHKSTNHGLAFLLAIITMAFASVKNWPGL